MRPVFRLLVNGEDLTTKVNDRLISLTITDVAGTVNDTLEITLDARPSLGAGSVLMSSAAYMPIPERGSIIEVMLGYEKKGGMRAPIELTRMGRFIYDEVRIRKGKAVTMSLRGKAIDSRKPFKEQKTWSWHNKTLGEIVKTIGERNGYMVEIEPVLAEKFVRHTDQNALSDMTFLKRLSLAHGAVMKVRSGGGVMKHTLYFARQGAAKELSGITMPEFDLDEEDCSDWEYLAQNRSVYKRAVAKTYDMDKAKETVVASDTGEPTGTASYEVVRQAPTEQEAMAVAEAKSNALLSTQDTLQFTVGGLPTLIAEAKVNLRGVWYPGIPRAWVITQATHSFTKQGGYVTSCSCLQPKRGKPARIIKRGVGLTG